MENVEKVEKSKQDRLIPRDILNGGYYFHWTSIDKLAKILKKGLYSSKFAEMIKDSGYETTIAYPHDEDTVYLSPGLEGYLHVLGRKVGYDSAVAIVIDTPYSSEKRRIAPRKFAGIVFDDKYLDIRGVSMGVNERIEQVLRVYEPLADERKLPIYGSSGSLYWPRQMSHGEIVQMLKTKEEGVV